MIQIDNTKVINIITNNIYKKLKNFNFETNLQPHVVIIRVIEDPVTNFYINKEKDICKKLGIKYDIYDYIPEVQTDHLKGVISKLSLNSLVTGIAIRGSLPDHINKNELIDEIDPIKDIDGITTVQSGLLLQSDDSKYRLIPPIVQAIYDYIPNDSNFISIINSNNLISKSLMLYIQEHGHNAIICSYENEETLKFVNNSDTIVLLSDKSNYFKSRYFYGKSNKVIIDGSLIYNKKLCGSLNIDDIENNTSISDTFKYTSILEGLGDLIVYYTIQNILITYKNQFDFIWKYQPNLNLKNN